MDACKGGWIFAVLQKQELRLIFSKELSSKSDLLDAAQLVLIDMPIGILGSGEAVSRKCDLEVRSLLQHRKSSVFAPPIRETLDKSTYQEALQVQRAAIGKGFSIQAWNLVPRIRELEYLLVGANNLQSKIWESHPELCFQQLFGPSAIEYSKHTEQGRDYRRQKIESLNWAQSLNLAKEPLFQKSRTQADVLDAAVLAVSAYLSNFEEAALLLPSEEIEDSCGLRMQIRSVLTGTSHLF